MMTTPASALAAKSEFCRRPRHALVRKTSSTPLTDMLLRMVVGLTVSGGMLLAAEPKTPNPPTLMGTQEARRATDLVSSVGVVVHLTYNQTPYADTGKVQQALSYTGIGTIRDATPPPDTRPYDYLASHGIKFDFVLRAEAAPELPATVRRLEAFAQRHPGAIAAIEGLNEVNNWPAKYKGLEGFPAAIAVQRDLYAAVKSSPTLKGVPVYALTLGVAGPADYAKLGDLSKIADFGNAHIYFPKGTPPSVVWNRAYELARQPTMRLAQSVVTETGYTTSKDSPHGVDEQVQAKYLLTLVVEAWFKRVPRVYIYQLVNDSLDETNWTRGLGLYRFDWTPKPAADAFHNLTSALLPAGSPTAATRQQPSLDLQDVRSTKDNVNSLAVRKTDGTVALIFWREQNLWDGEARKEIPTTTAQISLLLASGYSHVTVFDPLDGKRTQISPHNGRFDFDLPDHPLVIETQFAGQQP